jgi:hypothetical protein
MSFEIVYEHSFIAELDVIEPDPAKQMYLAMRIEAARTRDVLKGVLGYGLVRIGWTQDCWLGIKRPER